MSQRISDIEMRAEFWMQHSIMHRAMGLAYSARTNARFDQFDEETRRMAIIQRFDALPHAHAEFPGLAACACGHLIGGHHYQTGHCEVITCGCPMYEER